jgi:hypothetical protein
VHCSVGCSNRGALHPSKTFPHPLNKPRPIVVPLIAIVFANKMGNSLPLSAINGVKEMVCMEADLMLRPPKPEQIHADAKRNSQNADNCSAKRNRHTRVDQKVRPTELITIS